jgi:hypothetical protein
LCSEKIDDESQNILRDIYELVKGYGSKFDKITENLGSITLRLERLATLIEVGIIIGAGLLVTFIGILIMMIISP